jgi:chaperone BCS1
MVRDIRLMSTVILDEEVKEGLLKDIGDFLHLTTQRWYSGRGFPYRRGYLLHRPPGTRKSSLSVSVAGHFDLDIYILSLASISDVSLKTLFDRLPQHYIVLLEDINAASPTRFQRTGMKDSGEVMTDSPPKQTNPT